MWKSIQDAASARLHVPYVLKVSFEFECCKTLKHGHLHNNPYVRHRLPETSRQSISLGVQFKAVCVGPVNISLQGKRQVQLTWRLQHTDTYMYNLLWLYPEKFPQHTNVCAMISVVIIVILYFREIFYTWSSFLDTFFYLLELLRNQNRHRVCHFFTCFVINCSI